MDTATERDAHPVDRRLPAVYHAAHFREPRGGFNDKEPAEDEVGRAHRRNGGGRSQLG